MLRFLLKIESIFLNFYDLCIYYKNQFISKYYNNKILHLAIYNNISNSYISIYNYDNICMLLYIWFFNLYKKYNMLYIENIYHITLDLGKNDMMIISYVKDNNIHKMIMNYELRNQEIDTVQPKFIYAILDETTDMTQDFEDFKDFILHNKTCYVDDIIFMISSFKNKNKTKEFKILKIMLDNNYDELVFKAEDILLINT